MKHYHFLCRYIVKLFRNCTLNRYYSITGNPQINIKVKLINIKLAEGMNKQN